MRLQKSLHQRHNPFIRIFYHIMPGVGKTMDLGLGEEVEAAVEEPGGETPIAHAPDQAYGMSAELGQSGLYSGKRVIARMAGMQWNVEYELLNGQPVLPRIVGRQ